MKKLEEIAFDYPLCRKQFEEFQQWLATKGDLSERNDVLPFFRARPQLAVLFGTFNNRLAWPNRIGWEFDIFGDFTCDLVVGEWERGEYCFVEFEDAQHDSIFQRQGKKATREWGRRFDHGYSQIIDWAHKLDGLSPSADLLARFDRYEIGYEAAFVIGRDQHLDEGEKQRLNWRSDKVVVNNKKVTCLTFDGLLSRFSVRVNTFLAVETVTIAAATKAAEVAKAAEAAKAASSSSGDPPTAPAKPPEQGP
ncbi:MAG TPA: Shedu anti-phage system protein SduA domain-containing protein [Gemmataceae bacterium]|nr:Shedu anti-phage system protein SduA domain-containing protein [Gemmataceae bacterium]